MAEVKLAVPYRLETEKKQNMDKLGRLCSEHWDKGLLDEKGWYHNVCQADECTLHIYYIPVLEWLRQK